jgi:hypothetical protein
VFYPLSLVVRRSDALVYGGVGLFSNRHAGFIKAFF